MGGKPHKLKWLEKYDGDMAASREKGREDVIMDMLRRGKTVEEIVDFCGYPYDQVKKVEESLLASAAK